MTPPLPPGHHLLYSDGRETLATGADEVKLQGDCRRARNTTDALDLVLAGADPAERQPSKRATSRPPRRADVAGPNAVTSAALGSRSKAASSSMCSTSPAGAPSRASHDG